MKERDYDAEIEKLILERDSTTISNSFKGKLAILLHDHFCGYNHTDGCSWLYEMRNGFHLWQQTKHQDYIKTAGKIIAESDKLQELTEVRVVSSQ